MKDKREKKQEDPAVEEAGALYKLRAVRAGVRPRREASVVHTFCERYGVTRTELTRLTGHAPRTIAQWAAGKQPGAPAKKQIVELERLLDALNKLMDHEDLGPWLRLPNEAFAGSTPLQVIERGETDRIWRMIYQLETGEPA